MQTIISYSAQQVFEYAQDGFKVINELGAETSNKLTPWSDISDNINELMLICHEAAAFRGWWHKLTASHNGSKKSYDLKERNVGELIALIHSELSEGLEAARKDLMSDHITEFTGLEEELADVLIRLFDMAGAANLRLGSAFVAKMKYNAQRADHSLEARAAEGGKKI